MISPLLLAALGLLAVAVLYRLLRRPSRPSYAKRPALLSPAELRFYRALVRAAPGVAVFVKVRLMDIVSVPEGAWEKYGARGSGMHLDFLLANAETTEPLLAVELDDKSHWSAAARERDGFKDSALASAGVPVLRVRAAGRYDVERLRAEIAGCIGRRV